MDLMLTHTLQRWRMDLLRFNFTIVHRPEQMLCECNLLSWYNLSTESWRHHENDEDPTTNKTITAMVNG
jgi:hypothetical protein